MIIINLGEIDYKQAYDIQLEEVTKVYEGAEDRLIVCSHPSVVTLGKKSTPADLVGWSGATYEIERGGQATYHGPGQIVIYPIINLKDHGQNIAGFLEAMESSIVFALEKLGITAQGNSNRGQPDFTGVWVGDSKIASIGIAVKRWVTYHGLAFNIYKDELAFKGINPCGFSSSIMVALEDIYPEKPVREDIENVLTQSLSESLSTLK